MRYGDFTNKKYFYKFYKNGYSSSKPKYITIDQYIDIDYTVVGDTYGSAYAIGQSVALSSSVGISGNGDSNFGLDVEVTVNTDEKRQIDIDGVTAIFAHGKSTTNLGSVTSYHVKLFDYKILYTTSGNTLKLFYGATELKSVTMSSSYTYIRIREDSGIIYIETSSNGITWAAWDDNPIDYDNDILRSTMEVYGDIGAGGAGTAGVSAYNIDISDQAGNLLAIESRKIISDLEYTQTINVPASTTNIKVDYSPDELPSYMDLGNYVEVLAYFENNNNISYEPILDENGDPILDENSEPIYGAVITEPLPEDLYLEKFSGYIDVQSFDYDTNTVILTVISHGEGLSNILMSDGSIVNNNVIEQLVQNTSESPSLRRQTFTPQSNIKVDGVRVRLSAAAGGTASVSIINVATAATIGTSHVLAWSGALSAAVYTLTFTDSIYLTSGTVYAIAISNGGASYYYQNTDVYSGGSRQQFSGGVWSNVAGDAYFEIYTAQENISFDYAGTITGLVDSIFDITDNAYSNLYVDEVDEPGYSVTTNVTLNTAKDVIDTTQKLSPAKYWYSIDLGTGGYRLKEYPIETEHTFVLGRDFTGFKLDNSISDIKNDFVFTGGDINEAQAKLAIRTIDDDSIGNYKLGLAIESNEKVTTYASAQLISDYEIESNNEPRQTTEIVVPASKYNIESIRIGDLVKVLNTNKTILSSGLQIANIQYNPYKVILSLDNSPRTINTTVDKIRRDINNTNTSGVSGVV